MSWNMFSRFGAGSDPEIVSFADLGRRDWNKRLDGRGRSRAPRVRLGPHSERSSTCRCRRSILKELPEGRTGRSHMSVGRAVAQCAEQGADGSAART